MQSDEMKEFFFLATSFFCSHFRRTHSSYWDSAKNDEWATLSPYMLRIILSSDCLQVSFEEKAFEMLEMWMSANHKSCNDDHNERNRVLFEFGKLIRWPLMEWFGLQQYLKKFESKGADQHPLRTLIIEALLYRASRFVNAAQKAPGRMRRRYEVLAAYQSVYVEWTLRQRMDGLRPKLYAGLMVFVHFELCLRLFEVKVYS